MICNEKHNSFNGSSLEWTDIDVLEFGDVWDEVVSYACGRPREGHTADEEDHHEHVREQSSEVHHLKHMQAEETVNKQITQSMRHLSVLNWVLSN